MQSIHQAVRENPAAGARDHQAENTRGADQEAAHKQTGRHAGVPQLLENPQSATEPRNVHTGIEAEGC